VSLLVLSAFSNDSIAKHMENFKNALGLTWPTGVFWASKNKVHQVSQKLFPSITPKNKKLKQSIAKHMENFKNALGLTWPTGAFWASKNKVPQLSQKLLPSITPKNKKLKQSQHILTPFQTNLFLIDRLT
jgi:hypothetical protein